MPLDASGPALSIARLLPRTTDAHAGFPFRSLLQKINECRLCKVDEHRSLIILKCHGTQAAITQIKEPGIHSNEVPGFVA